MIKQIAIRRPLVRRPEVKQPKSDALRMLGNHLFASRSSKSYKVKTCLVANLQVREQKKIQLFSNFFFYFYND